MPLLPAIEAFLNNRAAAGLTGEADALLRMAVRALAAEEGRVPHEIAWPVGGGICGELLRTRDWRATPLGPVVGWSDTLRTTISTILHSPAPKMLVWGAGRLFLYNDAFLPILGERHPVAFGAVLDEAWPALAALHDEVAIHRDACLGDARRYDLFHTPIRGMDGAVAGVMVSVHDTTEREAAARALSRSEAELRTVTDALPLMVAYVDDEQIYRFANRHYQRELGLSPEWIVGRHLRDILGEEQYRLRLPLIERALAGEDMRCDVTLRFADGSDRAIELRYLPRRTDTGVAGFYVIAFDVQERVSRRLALEISTRRFQAAVDALDGQLWVADAAGELLADQPGWSRLTGQGSVEFAGTGWAEVLHPDDRAASIEAWQKTVASFVPYHIEQRVRRPGGVYRNFMARAVPVRRPDGSIIEWVGLHLDITHQREAEAKLRQLNETLEARVHAEIEERRQAQALLAQAQKMESIGKLTGGIAHDFNNLLQVISGNLQLMERAASADARLSRRVAMALEAVGRGARLAAQLLAFGRRQPLEPKVIDVTRCVLGMDEILRRTLGGGIAIETVQPKRLWNIFIDPIQIETALLNLAINARDAMGGAGRLVIALDNVSIEEGYIADGENVACGDYVMLAVTDSGCGMTPDVQARVFEPFFSTKEEGRGSGLGLSMVYGFVKQSGGHVAIQSSPGQGTTIRLYLPRSLRDETVETAAAAEPLQLGSETILLAEDDAAVRRTSVEILEDLGYHVVQASDGQGALALLEAGIACDLLLTDAIMPGSLKSTDLVRRARLLRPGLPVLFVSGYAEDAIVHDGRLDQGVDLLSKPYSREALARKLRGVLEA